MKIWSFVKGNPAVALLVSGISVCLLFIGLIISDMMGVNVARELLRSGSFYACVFILFVLPYFVVLALGGKG